MRRVVALLVSLGLAAGGVLVAAPPAQALDPTVDFTADALPTYQVNGIVFATAAQGQYVVAGGRFTRAYPPGGTATGAGSVARANLVILDAATGNPTGCQLDVALGTMAPIVRTVAAGTDGRTVYVGGLFSSVGGVARSNIAAIDVVSCTVRTDFRPNASSYVNTVLATADRVYVGGAFTSFGGSARNRLAAATPAGALTNWAPSVDQEVRAVVRDPNNGNIVLGGIFSNINGVSSHALGVVDGNTGSTVVKAYPPGFYNYSAGTGRRQGTSSVKSLAADANGFYVGNEGDGGGVFDGRTALYWGSNGYNERWRDRCLGATQTVLAFDNVLYAGHHAHDCSQEGLFEDGKRHHLSAQSTVNETWYPWSPDTNDGQGEALGPRALTVATVGSSRYLWLGGEFTTVNGASQTALTRFGQTDTVRPATVYTPSVSSTVAGQITVSWRASLDLDDASLTYKVYRGSDTTNPIGQVTAESAFWKRPHVKFIDTNVTPGQTYSYRITATDSAGNVSTISAAASGTARSTAVGYANAVVGDGAQTYFRLDDTGSIGASLGLSDRAGIYYGSVTRGVGGAIAGAESNAVTFNGSDSFLHTEVRETAPTTYSLELWFRTTTTQGGKLIGFGNRAATNETNALSSTQSHNLYMRNDGRITFGPRTNQVLTSPTALNNGAWHHVVATQGSAGMRLYVDGVQVGSNSTTSPPANSGYWRIGGDQLNGWPSRPSSNFFAGSIDEVAIYTTTAISAARVQSHYNTGRNGAPADETPPSAPGNAAASVSGQNVQLSWTAATDNVGVTGYRVFRSTSNGFTPSAANQITTVPGTSFTDTPGTGTWYYRVIAQDGAGNTGAASAQVSGVVAGAADTQAPTTPGTPSANVVGSSVNLAWSASTDNVGVTGYRVHRGTTAGFTPAAGNLVATVPSTSYADSPGTGAWFYRIVAVDAAGNASAASGSAAAVVVAAGQTISVTPTADTYANQSAATTNYGASTSLASRGTAGYTAYMRFDLPAAPAGTQLTGARLQVRSTTETFAGTVDSHAVSLTDNGWGETTLVWNNRPALGAALGTIDGAVNPNTTYTSSGLAVAPLAGLLGGQASIGVSSSGTDNLWFWARSHSTASYRPTLILEFSPIPTGIVGVDETDTQTQRQVAPAPVAPEPEPEPVVPPATVTEPAPDAGTPGEPPVDPAPGTGDDEVATRPEDTTG